MRVGDGLEIYESEVMRASLIFVSLTKESV